MTEAGWTAAVTQEGWYWWSEGPREKHKMVRVTKGYKALRVEVPLHNSWMFGAVNGFGGQFKGPLTPDSYQQGRVAACVWKHDDTDDYYETACNRGYSLEDGTLEENYHKYCPYCGGLIQLAQQARDKKEVGE